MKKILSILLVWVVLHGAPAHAEPAPEPTQTPLRSATVRAVGDIMMHKEQLDAQKKKTGYDFHTSFKVIAGSLQAADFTMGNLEGTIGKANGKGYSGFPAFNAPPALLDALKDAGFDLLTLANNHMLDRFEQGVQKTLDNLDERQMPHVGANRTPEERDTLFIFEVNGIKLGVLAYAEQTNGMERYTDPGVLPFAVNLISKTNIAKEVEAIREAGADVVIACVHWGTEYERKPDDFTVKTAQRLADAGVDVIVGSHPHVVQKIAWLKRADGGRTLCAYSLGNFTGYMFDPYTCDGIIFQFTVQERTDGGFEVTEPSYVPIFLWKGGLKRGGRVVRPVPIGKLWNEPLEQMSKENRKKMRQSYRDTVALIGKKVAQPLDE